MLKIMGKNCLQLHADFFYPNLCIMLIHNLHNVDKPFILMISVPFILHNRFINAFYEFFKLH